MTKKGPARRGAAAIMQLVLILGSFAFGVS